MESLVHKLTNIKKSLSDRVTWELQRESPGYGTYNLQNELVGLWCCYQGEEKRDYVMAYDCVARSAINLLGDKLIQSMQYTNIKLSSHQDDDDPFCPKYSDIIAVHAFEKLCTHQQLMSVLDEAISYAKIYIFS